MKKLIVSGVALLLTAATLSARSDKASLNISDKKTKKEDKRAEKKDERLEKRELRKLEGPQVGSRSKNNFYGDFGSITDVTWNRGAYFDEATFKQDNTTETAYYDDESNLVGTTTVKTFEDLPENIQEEILKKYADYNVGNVVFFDDNEYNDTDMFLYGTQFQDEDSYFVELSKGDRQIILTVSTDGAVSFFNQLS